MSEMSMWLERVLKRDTLREVQSKTGISHSTLSRKLPDDLSAEQVIQLARGYDAPVIDALVAAGHLSPADRLDAAATAALTSATDEQLADEVLRRMRRSEASAEIYNQPLSELHPKTCD